MLTQEVRAAIAATWDSLTCNQLIKHLPSYTHHTVAEKWDTGRVPRLKDGSPRYTPVYGSHGFIRDHLRTLPALSCKTICDAGAGLGFSMYLLGKHLGAERFEGVELSRDACTVTNENLKKHKINGRMYNKNILDHDFSKYDLVYSYHPMVSIDDQFKLDLHILRSMRPGAYYFRLYLAPGLDCIRQADSSLQLKSCLEDPIDNNHWGNFCALYQKEV